MTKDTEALLNMSLDEIIASGRGQNRPKNASGKPAKNSGAKPARKPAAAGGKAKQQQQVKGKPAAAWPKLPPGLSVKPAVTKKKVAAKGAHRPKPGSRPKPSAAVAPKSVVTVTIKNKAAPGRAPAAARPQQGLSKRSPAKPAQGAKGRPGARPAAPRNGLNRPAAGGVKKQQQAQRPGNKGGRQQQAASSSGPLANRAKPKRVHPGFNSFGVKLPV